MWNCKTPKAETVKHHGFPGGSDGKESSHNAEDPDSIPGGEISWRREWLPAPVLLPGEQQCMGSQRVGHDWVTKNTRAHVKLLEDYIGENLSMTMMFRHYSAKWGKWLDFKFLFCEREGQEKDKKTHNRNSLLVGMKNGAATLEDRWFLRKLNILLSYDPAVVLLGIYTNDLNTYIHAKTCTWLCIETLFRITQTRKQPRCSWVGKLIF